MHSGTSWTWLGVLGLGPPWGAGPGGGQHQHEALVHLKLSFLEASLEKECGQRLLDCQSGWAARVTRFSRPMPGQQLPGALPRAQTPQVTWQSPLALVS